MFKLIRMLNISKVFTLQYKFQFQAKFVFINLLPCFYLKLFQAEIISMQLEKKFIVNIVDPLNLFQKFGTIVMNSMLLYFHSMPL